MGVKSASTVLTRIFHSRRNMLWLFIVCSIAWVLNLKYGGPSDATHDVRFTLEELDLWVDPQCKLTETGCRLWGSDVNVLLETSKPMLPLQPFTLQVRKQTGTTIPIEEIIAEFEMVNMDMGSNRYALLSDAQREQWQAKVVLPICTTGKTLWQLRMIMVSAQRRYIAVVPIVLDRR